MKTKVLTVLSATVTTTCLESDGAVDGGASGNHTQPISLSASSLTSHWVPPDLPGSSTESLICYELEKQWWLFRQPKQVRFTSHDTTRAGDRTSVKAVQLVAPTLSRWQLPLWPGCHLSASEWRLLESPFGSHTYLSESDGLTPSLVLDQAGQYKVQFQVCPRLQDSQQPLTTPVIVSDLLITADTAGAASLAIALADFKINPVFAQAKSVPHLFRVAVYVGFTPL